MIDRRWRPRRSISGVLLVIPLWLAWITVLGWSHTRDCITAGLDAERASAGEDLLPYCLGPSWNAPLRGLNWASPFTGEVLLWIFGTAVALATIVLLLMSSSRR